MFDEKVITWLLQDDNPAVKYRTKVELLGQPSDISEAKAWIYSKLPKNWYKAKGLWYIYYITAIAECGLSYKDIDNEHIEKALDYLDKNFECGCADFMLLTALIKLGLCNHKIVLSITNRINAEALPDGGFLCLHRVNKLSYSHKSCYKANLHALMFVTECHKRGVDTDFTQSLVDYFLNSNIFYKSADKSTLVLNSRDGWQTTDIFYPFEVMCVGIQNVMESFAKLGVSNDTRLDEAWNILESLKYDTGKVILKGTLTKSYLPKEKIGKPSKSATFYILLAEKNKND